MSVQRMPHPKKKVTKACNTTIDISEALEKIAQNGINHILLEGGGRLAGSFFEKHLIDEVILFIAPIIIGGAAAPGPLGSRKAITRIRDAAKLRSWKIDKVNKDLIVRGEINYV